MRSYTAHTQSPYVNVDSARTSILFGRGTETKADAQQLIVSKRKRKKEYCGNVRCTCVSFDFECGRTMTRNAQRERTQTCFHPRRKDEKKKSKRRREIEMNHLADRWRWVCACYACVVRFWIFSRSMIWCRSMRESLCCLFICIMGISICVSERRIWIISFFCCCCCWCDDRGRSTVRFFGVILNTNIWCDSKIQLNMNRSFTHLLWNSIEHEIYRVRDDMTNRFMFCHRFAFFLFCQLVFRGSVNVDDWSFWVNQLRVRNRIPWLFNFQRKPNRYHYH